MMVMSIIAPTGDMSVPDGSNYENAYYVVHGNPTFGSNVDYVLIERIRSNGQVASTCAIQFSGDHYYMGFPGLYFPIRIRATAYRNGNLVGTQSTPFLTENDFVEGLYPFEYIYSPHCVPQSASIGI